MTFDVAAGALWGKSGTPPLSLLAHSLDTAAVTLSILEREPARTRLLYSEDLSLPLGEALRWVAFFVSLHDLGKASPVFQASWPEGAGRLRAAGLHWDQSFFEEKRNRVFHGVLTEVFLDDALRNAGLRQGFRQPLARCLGAHHGFAARPDELNLARRHYKLEPEIWKGLRLDLFKTLMSALALRGAPAVVRLTAPATLRLMALASFADWVASDSDRFPLGRDPAADGFWHENQRLADQALDHIGWRPRRPLVALRLPLFREVFPFAPNSLQETVMRAVGTADGPVLLLVEAPMGLGKTEAALYAHLSLQQRADHRGLYAALPTQATGNGLFPRVKGFLNRLSDARGDCVDLQLQHGAAVLNPEYQALKPSGIGEKDEGVVAGEWFSAKKRAMLSEYGVGTLDQALLGVLKVKHHFIRLWGLMNRTVVLDEVHAYDTYTSGLLLALLKWLKALGSSAIVMTATLPSSKRKALLSTWGTAPSTLGPYPRVVVADGTEVRVLPVPVDWATRVHLVESSVEPLALAGRLKERLPGVLGAVLNTVDRAQSLYLALGEGEAMRAGEVLGSEEVRLHVARLRPEDRRRSAWEAVQNAVSEAPHKANIVVGKRLPDGTQVFLLHARFPAEERALREQLVLALFGKEGPRPERAILVATQVAEQSLDLDFDLLYSDLAPIDLLFQRAGRLQRHNRERPKGHDRPVLLVGGLSEPRFGPPLHWCLIYDEYVLLSTWLALQGRDALDFPADLEVLLEEVYERAPDDFPEDLRARAEEAWRELERRLRQDEETARNLALFDLEALVGMGKRGEDWASEFGMDDEAEDGETQRLLTRLGDPSVAVVPLFRVGDELFLDPEAKRPARVKGSLSAEEIRSLYERAVRLSRYPVTQALLGPAAPSAWLRHALTRNLRPLEVGSAFDRVRVELCPELGVVYQGTG